MPGVISQISNNESVAHGTRSPGLPLERYTSQWAKNMAKVDNDETKGCFSSRNKEDYVYNDEYGVAPMFDYAPRTASNYDFQCIFTTFA